MTKNDMAKAIAEQMGVTQDQAREIIQRVFDSITETLTNEGRIELRSFGIFEVKKRKPRTARNPRTGEKVLVPAKLVVTFKPGREMEERVGQLQTQPEAPHFLLRKTNFSAGLSGLSVQAAVAATPMETAN
jgi:integration host factor subunit beta